MEDVDPQPLIPGTGGSIGIVGGGWAGMAAALPYVDVFLPGHNLHALESLADALRDASGRRSHVRPSTLRGAA